MRKVSLLLALAFVLGTGSALASDAAPAPPAKVATKAPASAPAAAPVASETPKAPKDTAGEKPAGEAAETPAKDTQKWWQGLAVTAIEGVVAIALPILSVLLMSLIRKWNLKIEQDKVDWALTKAVGFAEQKAKVALKDGKPMEGPELAKIAVDYGTKLLEKYKLASKFGGWLADGIEAKLGEKVVEAGGAKKVVNGDAPKPTEG